LPLQQQHTLKRLLDSAVPDIDALVTSAGRTEWNAHNSIPSKEPNMQNGGNDIKYVTISVKKHSLVISK
jgi:hypothetical protein